MGVLFESRADTKPVASKVLPPTELLWSQGCRVCPRNKDRHLRSPKMLPTGSDEPLILIIGEAPGENEDKEGEQFVGASGDLLRPLIPRRLRSQIMWDNTTRCWPGKGNPTPEKIEIECCRPLLTKSIERAKPTAIFGMGSVPLSWAGKQGGVTLWRGRRFPVTIGTHTCWYYPMFHPSYALHLRRNGYKSDEEFAFEIDLKRAIAEVEAGLPPPVVWSADDMRENVTCFEGKSKKELAYIIDFLEYAGTCAVAGVDYETQNERPYYKDSELLTIAVSVTEETVAFGYKHPETMWSDGDREKLTNAFLKFLVSRAKKAVHQLAFEMEWTCFYFGSDYARTVPWEDTLTQAFVIDERVGEKVPFGLGFLTSQYFGIDIKKLTRGLNKKNMKSEPLHVLLPYNGIDAKAHRLLYSAQQKRIHQEKLVEVYYEKLEQVPSVVLTQLKGIEIDLDVNYVLQREYERRLEQITDKIDAMPAAQQYFKTYGEKFNPGSPQQVVTMLRYVLKTNAGQEGNKWSSKESVLEKVSDPIAQGILDYREVAKLKGTYVDPVAPGRLFPGNVIHTNLGTCFTETGRLESTDPNIQNWPIRSETGKRVRRQVKAGVFASFDYGQIDARIIACGSRDRHYCKALWEDYDIHLEWAQRLAHHYPDWVGGKKYLKDEDVLGKFRNKVKNSFVFALFYGASLKSTARRFNVDESVIKPIYDAFWKQFAGVKDWQAEITAQYDELGYVQLFGGLRRRAPMSHGQKINSPVQGATNRIVMSGMNRLSALGDISLQANFQIHDDLSFCFTSEREFEDNIPIILDTMLDGREFDWFCVPLVIEAKSGPNWSDTQKIGVYSSVDRLGWPHRSKEFR